MDIFIESSSCFFSSLSAYLHIVLKLLIWRASAEGMSGFYDTCFD
jgi:hypothetical protein